MVEYETGRLNRAYAGFGASILNRAGLACIRSGLCPADAR
jgi:hypothetical protein